MDSLFLTALHESLETLIAHIIQHFMRSMKQHGLSTHQIHALMYIYHAGECQVSDIGALADVSKAAASQLVERLVQQDLVERREDPADRRIRIVRLSARGKRLISESVPAGLVLTEAMAPLTPDQREAVRTVLAMVAQAVERMHISGQGKDNDHA